MLCSVRGIWRRYATAEGNSLLSVVLAFHLIHSLGFIRALLFLSYRTSLVGLVLALRQPRLADIGSSLKI